MAMKNPFPKKNSLFCFKRAALALTLLIALSSLILLPNSEKNLANAQPIVVDPSIDHSLLKYEWPQFQGDSSFTRFSAGPAPEASDILWKADIPGISSYVSAFNGYVYVTTKTEVYALDRTSGDVIWKSSVPARPLAFSV
jgi:hypothetical protein